MSSAGSVEPIGWRVPADGAEGQEFPFVRSPLYGDIPAPDSLGMLFQYLDDILWARPWLECWRGQPSINWRLDSTAARRLLRFDTDIEEIIYEGTLEERVLNYETRLLDQARMAGHGIQGGRELSDLELLSVLRHYGAATRLMDFTRNIMVALWFASVGTGHEDDYGLLVGLEVNEGRHLQTEADLKRPIAELVQDKYTDEPHRQEPRFRPYWYWEPRHLFERMRVQQSLFVFGEASNNSWGTAPFPLERLGPSFREAEGPVHVGQGSVLIAVPASLKETMVDYGPGIFGYDARSLFPDIEGFSQYHGTGQRFEKKFFLT